MKTIFVFVLGFVVLVALVAPFILRWSIMTAFGIDLPPITPITWLAYNVLVSAANSPLVTLNGKK